MKDFDQLNIELESAMPALADNTDTMAESFSDIVFSYRVRQGLTQQQLANKAEVAVKTIHRIEGGSGGITDTTYEKVFKALDLNWQDVISFVSEKKKVNREPVPV